MDIGEHAVKFLQKAEDRLVIIAEKRTDYTGTITVCWKNAKKLYSDLLKASDVGWHWWHFCQW
jgi:hypothetical protein